MGPTPLSAFDGDHEGYQAWSRSLHIRLTEGNLECLWAIAGDLFEFIKQEKAHYVSKGTASSNVKAGKQTTSEIPGNYKVDALRKVARGSNNARVEDWDLAKDRIMAGAAMMQVKDLKIESFPRISKEEEFMALKEALLRKGLQKCVSELVFDLSKALSIGQGQESNMQQSYFRPFLTSNEQIKAMVDEGLDVDLDDWNFEKALSENALVVFLLQLRIRYDAKGPVAAGTIMERLHACLDNAKGGSGSFHEADQVFTHLLGPLAKSCSTPQEMFEALRASFGKLTVKKLAEQGGEEAKCWQRGHADLVEAGKEGMIDWEIVRHAVGKAEAHLGELQRDKPRGGASSKQGTKSANMSKDAVEEFYAAMFAKFDKRLEQLTKTVSTIQPDSRGPKRENKEGQKPDKTGKGNRKPHYCPGCEREVFHALENCRRLKAKMDAKSAALAKTQSNDDDKSDSDYSDAPTVTLKPCTDQTEVARGPEHCSRLVALSHKLPSASRKGPCLDSGAQVAVTPRGDLVVRYKDKTVYLQPVHGKAVATQAAEIGFPTTTEDGSRWTLHLKEGAVHAAEAKEDLLSLALLLKAGYDVRLAVGTSEDPHFGGHLYTPCGKRIKLLFIDDLWRLPPPPQGSDGQSVSQAGGQQPAAKAAHRVWVTKAKHTTAEQMRLCHAAWCHPDATTMRKIHAAYKDDPQIKFPVGFRKELQHFHCSVCQLCKGHRPTRHSSTFKRKQDRPAEPVSESNDAKTSDTPVADQVTDTQPSLPEFYQHISEYAQELGLSDLWAQYRMDDAANTELGIDYAHSIAVSRQGHRYYLVMVFGKNVIQWASPAKTRQLPEALIQEFINLTGIRVTSVRFDDAAEFGRSSSFKHWAQSKNITLHPVQGYTHTLNARAENAVKITKTHVRCMLTYANMTRSFWPHALAQFCRIYGYWPKQGGYSSWELCPNHRVYLDPERDLQVIFGCYMTAHLPREHPLVEDTTHSDRAEEGVFLSFDVSTPMAWMYSFRRRKVVKVEPKHFSPHVLPFRTPDKLVHRQHYVDALKLDTRLNSASPQLPTGTSPRPRKGETQDIGARGQGAEPEEGGEPEQGGAQQQQNAEPEDGGAQPGNGGAEPEDGGDQPEQQGGYEEEQEEARQEGVRQLRPRKPKTAASQNSIHRQDAEHKRPKRVKPPTAQGKDIPLKTDLKDLSDKQLANALAYHQFKFELPPDYWNNRETGQTEAATVIIQRAQRISKYQFVWGTIVEPKEAAGEEIQLPISPGPKNFYEKWHLRQALDLKFNQPRTLEDLGLPQSDSSKREVAASALAAQVELAQKSGTSKVRRVNVGSKSNLIQAMLTVLSASVLADLEDEPGWEDWDPTQDPDNPLLPQHLRRAWAAQVAGASEAQVKDLARDDMLEPDPPNREQAMKHPRFAPFWKGGEKEEWNGLWSRNCFKKWNVKDLKDNDRVFGSRYHYKIKRDTVTGQIKRFKVRLVVQGHLMKDGVDYDEAYAPVPHAVAGRTVMSLAVANSLHLHAVDLTQAFIQADRIPEGVNGRVFIRPPPGSEEDDPSVVYEVLRPLYGIPSSARALHLTLDKYLKSQGFEQVGCEQSVWQRPAGGIYPAQIILSAHIDDNLIACESLKVLQAFKRDFLSRFDGTDEGEVSQYLGCQLSRDWKARTGFLNQKVYAEKMLQKYDMWNAHPVKTPMEPGTRLTKADCPEVVDPQLQHRYRSVCGELGWLANNTRPDLAFVHNELSKFLHCPGQPHWECALRALAYLRGTTDLGITWRDTGATSRNKLGCFVDSDYAACVDTRRSQTGYVITMNGGPVSWKARRQKNVTMSSCEAEFYAASDAGKEIEYVRALLRGLGYPQRHPTVVWEDNASAIVMSEHGTSSQRSRHIDIRVHRLREMVEQQTLKLHKVKGTDNPSDALTKSVPGTLLERHRPHLLGSEVHPLSIACLSRLALPADYG